MNSNMRKLVLTFLMTISVGLAFGVRLTIKAPNVVAVGETFQIAFTVDATPDQFIPPALSDFRVIAGPGRASSISIVNGQQSATTIYTYYVEALKEGTFSIGQAEVIVDGISTKSSSYSIEVVKAGAGATTQGQQGQQQGQQRVQSPTSASSTTVDAGDLFARVEVSRSSLYRGESLVATIKIYTLVGISNLSEFKVPPYTGFYSQDMEIPASESSLHRENVNGKIYNVAVLKRSLLFPQKAGTLTIDPAEMSLSVQLPRAASQTRSIFDDFFAMPDVTTEKKLKTPVVSINVKDLPSGAPASFKGAVGNFKMEASIDKTETTANQALLYSLTISGKGNLKLLEEPKINFPPDFDKYDPKVNDNIQTTATGSSGSKKFEYAIIPRSAGSFNIEGTEFTFFDPAKGAYTTLRSNDLTITVEKDPYGSTAQSTTGPVQGVNQENIRRLGNDIVFIKTAPLSLQAMDDVFFGSGRFWLIIGALLVAALLAWLVLRKQVKERSNVALMRNKKANKMAKQRLKKSAKLLKEDDEKGFYEEISRATWGYVGDKLNIPAASLSRDNVQGKLLARNVPQEDVDLLLKVMDDCEYARYAPGSGHSAMEHIYNDTINVISKIESSRSTK